MARISGVDIPRDKQAQVSLTYIFGIGLTTSQQLLTELEIDPTTRVKDLTDSEVAQIRGYIEENLKVEGDLRRQTSQDIKRKMEIGSTRDFAIVAACLFVVSGPTPMPAHARVQRRPSPERRRLSNGNSRTCLLYTSPSPRDRTRSRMPSSA